MPVMRLGRREIGGLKPVDRPVIYYDEVLKGFGLRVMPPTQDGHVRRTWLVEYRPNRGGRRVAKRRLSIGSATKLTPEQARDRAKKLLAQVALGEDPAAELSRARKGGTVADLLERYMSEVIRAKRKERTAKVFDGYVRNHIVPAIGARQAHTINRTDVARLHREIGSDYPTTANRILTVLGAAFAYGIQSGFFPDGFQNPARGVDRYRELPRERYLSEAELARLGAALQKAETTGIFWAPDPEKKVRHAPKPEHRRISIDQFDLAAIRLLLLSGMRLREVLDLRWADVDLQRGVLNLPDSKTGRKPVLLGEPAVALLKALERNGPYVIPDPIDPSKPRGSIRRAWLVLSREAGLERVRLHDLRHSFGATGAGAGLGLQIVGRLLGHSSPSTTSRYAHLSDGPLRRAADSVSEAIAAALRKDLSVSPPTADARPVSLIPSYRSEDAG